MPKQGNKLAMSWNVAFLSDEKVLAAIEKYSGEHLSYSEQGRRRLMLAQFPDDEQAHQCLLTLEMFNMHVELWLFNLSCLWK